MQPARLPDEVRARPEVQVVGVPEHHPRASGPQVSRSKPLNRALRPDRHERRRLYRTVRRKQDAGPRFAVAGDDLDGDRRVYCDLPPFMRSIASPKE